MEKPNLIRTWGRIWSAVKGFVARRWDWMVTGLIAALVLWALIHALYWVPGAGFGGYVDGKGEWQRGKTLWDWLGLLIVPLALAGGAALFTWVTNRREQATEEARAQALREAEDRRAETELAAVEKRAQTDREIELDRARAAALQTYLDRTTALLRDKWHESGGGFVEADIIRAQTLTVLRQLDGERKGLLLRFLYESGLIGKVRERKKGQKGLVDLSMAELIGANLLGVDLRGAGLLKVILREADLRRAWMNRADLRQTDLREANLAKAVLCRADLRGANLRGADLGGAYLLGANLFGATLLETNLLGADLSEANLLGTTVTDEQLAQVKSLAGATMPDGTKHE
jgi:uncharacterized protein YjbI with pentapeptide repeats